MLEQQKLKLQNDARQLAYDEKKLESDFKLAEKSIQVSAEYHNNKHNETRKTITRFAYIVGGMLFLFLGFISYWLMNGKQEFVTEFLHGLNYVVISLGSYWFGTKNKKKQNLTEGITEAETVD